MKKIFTGRIVCAGLCLSMTGCSTKDYSWIIQVDGQPVDNKTYINAQMHIYMEAQLLSSADGGNALGGEIDGEDASRWIDRKTVESVQRIVYVNNEFKKRGLKTDPRQEQMIENYCREGWKRVSPVYTANGLDKEDYIFYLTHKYKEQLLFEDIYLNGGEKAVSDRYIQEFIKDKMCRVSLFKILKTNGDGTLISRENIANVKEVADMACKAVDDGMSMIDAAEKYIPMATEFLNGDDHLLSSGEFVYIGYLNDTNTSVSRRLRDAFFRHSEKECFTVEESDCIYVCLKLPLWENGEEYESIKKNAARLLKDREFDEYLSRESQKLKVELNRDAVEYYSPSKIKINF